MRLSAFCILKYQGKFLLNLRDDKPGIYDPGCWAFLGGKIESDEEPLEAIKRELAEEISCQVQDISFFDTVQTLTDGEPETLYLFSGKVYDSPEHIQLFEGQRLGLFAYEELLELKMSPTMGPYVKKSRERLLQA